MLNYQLLSDTVRLHKKYMNNKSESNSLSYGVLMKLTKQPALMVFKSKIRRILSLKR